MAAVNVNHKRPRTREDVATDLAIANAAAKVTKPSPKRKGK